MKNDIKMWEISLKKGKYLKTIILSYNGNIKTKEWTFYEDKIADKVANMIYNLMKTYNLSTKDIEFSGIEIQSYEEPISSSLIRNYRIIWR